MRIQTALTRLVGIEHPVVQTGMGWVAGARLVSATANAGGLGILAAATMTIEVPNTTPGTSEMPNTTPATIEAPNGSRHAMDVELDGLTSTAELRRGMLQGYRELLGVQLPPHALRVHARLRSGSSVLLTDETPLSSTVLEAVAFYVWAVFSPDDMRSIKP